MEGVEGLILGVVIGGLVGGRLMIVYGQSIK